MIVEICVGSSILLIVLVIIFLILRSRPFTARKTKGEHDTTLTIMANKNIHRIIVMGGDITFERAKIKKGQTIDFAYPNTGKSTKLIVEVEAGKQKTYEM